MRYREVSAGRFRLPPSHPVLATLTIDPVDWQKLERMTEDNPVVRLLGHDEPHDEQMVVYLGCASHATRDRLEDGWG
jgi:hypothetical protein